MRVDSDIYAYTTSGKYLNEDEINNFLNAEEKVL